MHTRRICSIGVMFCLALGCDGSVETGPADSAQQACTPFSVAPCQCPTGTSASRQCVSDGSGFTACDACTSEGSGGNASGGMMETGGAGMPGSGGEMTGGRSGTGGSASGGTVAASGGDAAPVSGGEQASGSVSGIEDTELEMLRQVCVDEINMYRATLSLVPLQRATGRQELCSDEGAKKDVTTGIAHSSAGRGNPCQEPADPEWAPAFPFFGSQNSCPGWGTGGRNGATIADALRSCLAAMWAEGEPPGGEDKCLEDYFNGDTACFLAHGHYLNMKGGFNGVSCGFYDMGDGKYWMNQDFY